MSHPSVVDRLSRLAPDQRAAATASDGPLLVVAPAGSGKTTTLVARVAWLVDGGVDPGSITVVAFNKRAAEELTERLDAALAPLGCDGGAARVRTFHALGREILLDAGVSIDPLIDRDELLRLLFPATSAAERGRLDLAFSRLKLDLRVTAADVAGDPEPGPVARAFIAYESAIQASGGVDFDDLLVRAVGCLTADPVLLGRWRARTATLLVDEAQDVDRLQLDLALLLAAPANDICLVGDDDQSIYGWRLADVRRILGLEALLPGLRRIDLEVNYRCPRPVVERAVRLVEHNDERFAKTIRAGPVAAGRLILAADAADETIRIERAVRSWPDDGTTRAILARTNRELLPAVVVALQLGLPFRAPRIELLLDSPIVDRLLDRAATLDDGLPLLVLLGRVRDETIAGTPRTRSRASTTRPRWRRRSWAGRSGRPTWPASRRGRCHARSAGRAAPGRCGAHARHRPRDQGARIRPRHRRRHGDGSLPERTCGQPGRGSRCGRTRRNGGWPTSPGPVPDAR